MFLKNLNLKAKNLFLELCVCVAGIDGNFDKNEKEMIYGYCDELGLERNIPYCEMGLDNLLNELCKNCCKSEKKIILLELYGLVFSDQIFSNEEEAIIDRYIFFSGMSTEEVEEVRCLYDEYIYLYDKMMDKLQIN